MLTRFHSGVWNDIAELNRGSEPMSFLRRYTGSEWVDMYIRELVLFRAGKVNQGFHFNHTDGRGCLLTSDINTLSVNKPLKSHGRLQSIPVNFSLFKSLHIKFDVLNLIGPCIANDKSEVTFEYSFYIDDSIGKLIKLTGPASGRFTTYRPGSYKNIEYVYDISNIEGIHHLFGLGSDVAKSYTVGGSLIYEIYFSYLVNFIEIWFD